MPPKKEFDPDAVLDDAMELFWERGYESTSVQDLVDGLCVNRSGLYRTFGSKRDLYLSALDAYRGRTGRRLRAQLNGEGAAAEAIRRIFEEVVEESVRGEERRGCFVVNAMVERAPHDADVAERLQDTFAHNRAAFRAAVERAQAEGDVDPDRDADALALHLLNTYHGLRVTARAEPGREALEALVASALSVL